MTTTQVIPSAEPATNAATAPVPPDAAPKPFLGAWDYLADWINVLELWTLSDGKVRPLAERSDRIDSAFARTEATMEENKGRLPVEFLIRRFGLDLTDRLLLVAFLADATDPEGGNGVTLRVLCAAAGATSLKAQAAIRSRLEMEGKLRSLQLIESDADGAPAKRFYRLRPHLASLLTTGTSSAPPLPRSDAELIASLSWHVKNLGARVMGEDGMLPWCSPDPKRPVWDPVAPARKELLHFLAEVRGNRRTALGKAFFEASLQRDEQAILALLIHDARTLGPHITAGFVATFVEGMARRPTPIADLLGPDGRLRRADLIDVEESGPFHARRVALTEAAALRLVPGTSRLPRPGERQEAREAPVDRVEPRTNLSDVVLEPALRDELEEALVWMRSRDELCEEWGFGDITPGGDGTRLLFEGPPGTGKTMTAEAIAGELGRPLLRVRYDQLVSKWVGETGKNIAALFHGPEAEASVVLIDEADAIIASRDSGHRQAQYEIRDTNQILQEIERFRGVLILTTNRAGALDPALQRRLTARLTFPVPGPKERVTLWRRYLPEKAPLDADVNFGALATRHAIAGSHIRTACLKAAAAAVRRSGKDRLIRQKDLDDAASKVSSKDKAGVLGFGAPATPRDESRPLLLVPTETTP